MLRLLLLFFFSNFRLFQNALHFSGRLLRDCPLEFGLPFSGLYLDVIFGLLNPINPHQPVLRREHFLHMLQLNVLEADFDAASAVIAKGLPVAELNLPETVVGEFVHEAVHKDLGAATVYAEVPVGAKVVGLADLSWVLALGDPHHPQEFVDVVAGIADYTT